MRIKIIIIVIIFFLLGVADIYFIINKRSISGLFAELNKRNETIINQRLPEERKLIYEELNRKYEQDMFAYESIAKQLEAQKSANKSFSTDRSPNGP